MIDAAALARSAAACALHLLRARRHRRQGGAGQGAADRQIAAAAIERVCDPKTGARHSPLLTAPNCHVTAHVAGVTHDTTMRIWEWAHDNVRAVVQRGEKPRWVRNGL
ncbi:MAG: hypothetical protein R3E68_12205 [Burkholderiaceae bacterium]